MIRFMLYPGITENVSPKFGRSIGGDTFYVVPGYMLYMTVNHIS